MDVHAFVPGFSFRALRKVLFYGFFFISSMLSPSGLAEVDEGGGVTSANQAAENHWHKSAVQVLAYKGNSLLNQGSGVLVAEGGVVVTSAHLLESADKIIVRDSSGKMNLAVIEQSDSGADMVVLRAGDMTVAPVTFSLKPVSEKDTLEIAGYWHLSQEKPRNTFFGLSNKPKFIAEVVTDIQITKALLGDPPSTGENLKLVTSIGRGAYGAPLVNRCGQLAGIVRPKADKTLKELWQPHTPLGALATKAEEIERTLEALSIPVTKASEPCLNVVEQQKVSQTAKQQEIDNAKKKAKQAEEDAKKAHEGAKKAKEEAEKEKQAREDAEKGREDISTIVSDINSKAALVESENTEIKEKNQTLLWVVIISIIVGLFLVVILIIKRRKDLSAANMALQAASASFGDCRFEGRDSAGSPIAFFVLGKDLIQRENGLIIGRNPDLAQVVISDDTVSRQHAQLFVKDKHLHIKDLGSTGGTRVNGVVVSGDGAAAISGDVVEFGQVRCNLAIYEDGK